MDDEKKNPHVSSIKPPRSPYMGIKGMTTGMVYVIETFLKQPYV